MMNYSSPLFGAAVMLFGVSPILLAEETVDFAREVLPVLSNKCFVCHGPDADESELRLDSREGATADLGGYRAIDPTDLKKSEILFRIHDKDDPMPPDKADHKLTESERNILSHWVRLGGEYSKHWSYVPPTRDQNETVDSLIRAGFPACLNGYRPLLTPCFSPTCFPSPFSTVFTW